MPGKRGSKVSASAKRENEKTIRTLFVNPEAYLFARIDSSLGAGGFRIVLNDSTIVTGIPRGLFNRRTLRINVGDIVLDNCMGSGSTGKACQNLNSKFIGIEFDEIYFQKAKKWLDE